MVYAPKLLVLFLKKSIINPKVYFTLQIRWYHSVCLQVLDPAGICKLTVQSGYVKFLSNQTKIGSSRFIWSNYSENLTKTNKLLWD